LCVVVVAIAVAALPAVAYDVWHVARVLCAVRVCALRVMRFVQIVIPVLAPPHLISIALCVCARSV